YNHACGKNEQIACEGSSPCDAGNRHVTFSGVTIDCVAPGVTDEFINGACVSCGGLGEMACGGSSQCSAGLARATTSGLNGSIAQCSSLLPADPPNININVPSFTIGFCPACITYNPPNVNINLPSTVSIVNSTGICSPGLPENLAGASRESWPAAEPASDERGTIVFIHGRGSSCNGKDALLNSNGGMLFERNHRMFCMEYDRASAEPTRRSVVVYEPTEQTIGEGPTPCAATGTCTWNLSEPLLEVFAPSYSVPGVAEAVAEAVQKIPTEGEITVVGHSQGGFIVRALVHEHYDELRWAGEKISRVITLGHPYYGKVVDPKKVAPWMCSTRDDFDCHVQEWLWGWQNWLGSTAGNIDDADFPQVEWSAVAGDGLNQAGTGPGGTAPEAEPDACLQIFGGVNRPNVEGDTSVPILSSLGIDEHGYYNVPALSFDDALETRCAHNASCQMAGSFATDPDRIPTVPAAGFPIPGALLFDGVDDQLGGLSPASLGNLEMDDAVTIEAWIWPDTASQNGIIVNKEGEYEFGLIAGELSWALAISSPNWAWVGSGFHPPLLQWTHVAFVYDQAQTTATMYVNGLAVHSRSASGAIGDAHTAANDLRIGGREITNERFAGKIADVRIWASARTAQQVREGASGVPDGADPDLRGWWSFDAGGGDTVLDGSSYAHDLSLTALGTSFAPYRRSEDRLREGGAMYFDGLNDRLTVTDPAMLTALEMSNFLVIEAWVYPRGPGGSGGGVIVNKEGEYALTRLTDGTIAFSLAGTSLGWSTVPTAASAPERIWTHVALAYRDGSPGSVQIYENGVEVDSIPASGLIGDFHTNLNELWIGGRQNTGNNQWFHGVIDEVRVWNAWRAPHTISKFYERTLPSWSMVGLQGYWRFDQATGSLAIDTSAEAHHASLGNPGAATTPTRSFGPALPDYPPAIFLPPLQQQTRCGLGAEIALLLPLWSLAKRRSRRRKANGLT
ncbi:MAG: hypothetical protein JRH01_06170, partial [Deltaproteobacteria bacterium]|nr:hypothetical protein [Deltaproteobacteria bacterium]